LFFVTLQRLHVSLGNRYFVRIPSMRELEELF
jgi:hypothetical protein